MGGFAGWHHNTVAKLEAEGRCRLVCTCDPDRAAFAAAEAEWRFPQRGVRVFGDFRAMLDACRDELDFVVIPTPIALHAEMHEAVTACGIPAYVEKPPSLDIAELERMIAADRRARKSAAVGFNFIVERERLALKERILSGEFGAVREATFLGLWPRSLDYFTRNDWAGRLVKDGRPVMDSVFGNASSHFVHNILFWPGGPGLLTWAQVARVRAELYRAHAIPGADTFLVEMETPSGQRIRIAMTHACAGESRGVETVRCERAVITWYFGDRIEICWSDGRTERIDPQPFDGLRENHLAYYSYLNGESPRPITTLEDCRPFVTLNDLAYISSGRISPFPSGSVSAIRDEKDNKDYLSVAGMARALEDFLADGRWPGANGWGRDPGQVASPADLPRLATVLRAMEAAPR